MNLKIAICDDNEQDIDRIHTCLEQYEIRHDIDFEVSQYTTPKSLLLAYDVGSLFHVLFLDVEMPEMNGIELAKHIRYQKDSHTIIVFISNYPRYMQDSFEVRPFHYLTKPLQEKEFTKVMSRIIQEYEDSKIHKLIILEDKQEELINLHDLLYIEALKTKKGYLLYRLNDHSLQGKGNLKDLVQELAPYHFFLCHRSILVNISYIHYIRGNSITLKNGSYLPLSRRKEKELKALFSKRILTLGTVNN